MLKKLFRRPPQEQASSKPNQPRQKPEPIPSEKVAQRAYEIWVANGRPGGTEFRDWLEAEEQLLSEATNPSNFASRKPR